MHILPISLTKPQRYKHFIITPLNNQCLSLGLTYNGRQSFAQPAILLDQPVLTDSSMPGFSAVWGSDYVVGSWKEMYANVYIPYDHWVSGTIEIKNNPDINLLELWSVLVSVWSVGQCKVRFKLDNTMLEDNWQ